jgi:hypothetical protein
MYIEFQLPKNPDEFNHGSGYARILIDVDIDDWVRKHDIQYHKTKKHKNTYRLVLKDDQAYTHFALTWEPKYSASEHFIFKQPK